METYPYGIPSLILMLGLLEIQKTLGLPNFLVVAFRQLEKKNVQRVKIDFIIIQAGI